MADCSSQPLPVHLKVSGITTPQDARLAAELGASSVACVFLAASPRYVTVSQARALRAALPSSVSLVGIFANTPPAVVRAVAIQAHVDLVQLFGSEPRSVVEAMQPRAFKAASITSAEELEAFSRAYLVRRPRPEPPALMVHLAGPMATAWDAASEVARRVPILLSSPRLDAETVGSAIAAVRPWGVDVWEAVESSPGHLDAAALEAFVTALRAMPPGT